MRSMRQKDSDISALVLKRIRRRRAADGNSEGCAPRTLRPHNDTPSDMEDQEGGRSGSQEHIHHSEEGATVSSELHTVTGQDHPVGIHSGDEVRDGE